MNVYIDHALFYFKKYLHLLTIYLLNKMFNFIISLLQDQLKKTDNRGVLQKVEKGENFP